MLINLLEYFSVMEFLIMIVFMPIFSYIISLSEKLFTREINLGKVSLKFYPIILTLLFYTIGESLKDPEIEIIKHEVIILFLVAFVFFVEYARKNILSTNKIFYMSTCFGVTTIILLIIINIFLGYLSPYGSIYALFTGDDIGNFFVYLVAITVIASTLIKFIEIYFSKELHFYVKNGNNESGIFNAKIITEGSNGYYINIKDQGIAFINRQDVYKIIPIKEDNVSANILESISENIKEHTKKTNMNIKKKKNKYKEIKIWWEDLLKKTMKWSAYCTYNVDYDYIEKKLRKNENFDKNALESFIESESMSFSIGDSITYSTILILTLTVSTSFLKGVISSPWFNLLLTISLLGFLIAFYRNFARMIIKRKIALFIINRIK